MKTLIMILIIAIATPALARSKKSQARLDKRHAAQAQADINRTKAETADINQGTSDRRKNNKQKRFQKQMNMGQQQHQQAIRNGNQYRAQKAQRSRKHTGF